MRSEYAALDTKALIARLRDRQLPPADERRRLRWAAGLSLREAAEALDVNAMTVARWESGVRPRAGNAARYRQFLDALAGALQPGHTRTETASAGRRVRPDTPVQPKRRERDHGSTAA